MDPLLTPFHRQYLQQIQPSTIRYPPPKHLVIPFVQDQIYKYFFKGEEEYDSFLPPLSYRHRVLKRILGDVERELSLSLLSFEGGKWDLDLDEFAISDDLMSTMGSLATNPSISEVEAAQIPRTLSYFLPINTAAAHQIEPSSPASTDLSKRILIRESPNLLAAGSNVGLRTWESCLHLAYYLSTNPNLGSQHKLGKSIPQSNIIELGSGTGLLSLICALQLHANHVLTTDGLPHVLEGITHNIDLNNPSENFPNSKPPIPALLDWTSPTIETDLDEVLSFNNTNDNNTKNQVSSLEYDYILGADITYHPELFESLAHVIRLLKDRYPNARCLICTTVRKESSLKLFHNVCEGKFGLRVRDIFEGGNGNDGGGNSRDKDGDKDGTGDEGWRCPPFREQTGLFHEQGFPIVIMDVDVVV